MDGDVRCTEKVNAMALTIVVSNVVTLIASWSLEDRFKPRLISIMHASRIGLFSQRSQHCGRPSMLGRLGITRQLLRLRKAEGGWIRLRQT